MDDHKRADKKHRKLTRTPEVSQCDTTIPNVLQLSSSSLSPTSGHTSTSPVNIPQAQQRGLSPSSRNHSATNVTATKDTIPASPSSLSFSSLLSSSASFFNHNHHHHHHHQKQPQPLLHPKPKQPQNNDNTSPCLHPSYSASHASFASSSGTVISSTPATPLLNPEHSRDATATECHKQASNCSRLLSPSSVSPAGNAAQTSSSAAITISRGLEYFCGGRSATENTNTFHKEHHPTNNNNYLNCTDIEGSPTAAAATATTIPVGTPTSPSPATTNPHLLKKPEETLSPSSSAFSLKRFSSFSFNRGSKTKRNVAKEQPTEPTPPPSSQQPVGRSGNAAHCETAAEPPPASNLTNTFAARTEDGTIGSGAKTISPRRNKVSTNPFHQHSSSTSTSSSMSYQLSTDNVTDIIPACCLKATPLQLQQQHNPPPPPVTVARGGGRGSSRESHDSTSSDGERAKVPVVSYVCSNCGNVNRLTGAANEVRCERLPVDGLAAKSQEHGLAVKESSPGAACQVRTNSPRTVQIQIKRNCPNARDVSSDRESEECTVAPDEFGHLLSTNPFLSDTIKRDEFLKATMRICLVVSPPATKLQVSKLGRDFNGPHGFILLRFPFFFSGFCWSGPYLN